MDIVEFEDSISEDSILSKHSELLKKLAVEDNTVCVLETEGKFYLLECCDCWHTHTLTKEECLELSLMFSEIAEKI